MGTSIAVDKSSSSGASIPSGKDGQSDKILDNLRSSYPKSAEVLRKMGLDGNHVMELFSLSKGDYKEMVFKLDRADFAMRIGVNMDLLRTAATGEGGRLDVESYFILVAAGDREGRIARHLIHSGVTGSDIARMFHSDFKGDIRAMHSGVLGMAAGHDAAALRTQG